MTDTSSSKVSQLQKVLAASRRAPRNRRLGWLLIAVALLILGAGIYAALKARSPKGPQYVSTPISKGDITVTVTATGNLQPINTVDVGSEISGTIADVFVDFNDKVSKGQILARLDTTKLGTALERSRATLASNQAKVRQATATLEETRLALSRLEDVARLSGGKLPAATELEAARAKLARAQADLAVTEAAVADSQGLVKQGETDLSKATIRSSTNGIVLKRTVERGQTVAASLQAPVLFSLAEDLAEMELIVAVSEADVGKIAEGMAATFTVDAWPDKIFPARIKQVRFGATTVDNVVSYQTVLHVKNEDLKLRPGMTATADIQVAEHKDVMQVPNAALRFKPPEPKKAEEGGVMSLLIPRAPQRPKPQLGSGRNDNGKARARLWVKDEAGGLRPVRVRTLLSDGRMTEIESDELKIGDEVVTDITEKAK